MDSTMQFLRPTTNIVRYKNERFFRCQPGHGIYQALEEVELVPWLKIHGVCLAFCFVFAEESDDWKMVNSNGPLDFKQYSVASKLL